MSNLTPSKAQPRRNNLSIQSHNQIDAINNLNNAMSPNNGRHNIYV